MIHKYTITNFYSIKNTVEINLVSKQSDPKAKELYSDIPFGKKVSKITFIGGPNASGKTNILRALAFLQLMIAYVNDLDNIPNFFPFFTTTEKPTELSVVFSIDNNNVFEYRVQLTIERILKESLKCRATVEERTSETTIYERAWNAKKQRYELKLSDQLPTIKSMTTTQEIINNNPRSSVIAVLFNFESKDGLLYRIRQYWENIASNIQVIGNLETNYSMIQLANKSLHKIYEDTTLQKRAVDMLRKYDIGVSDIKKEEKVGPNHDQTIYLLEHLFDNARIGYSINYESSGTQKMLILLEKIVLALDKGSVAVIDELDAFLHPDIFNEIVGLFMSTITNPKAAQLIFSSQNYSVLTNLDKQQIILVEKTKKGETEAWRLDEVEGVRADENFYTKYLAGAYGAVPQIG